MPVLNLTNDEADVLYAHLNSTREYIRDGIEDGHLHAIDTQALLIKLDMIRPNNEVGWRGKP